MRRRPLLRAAAVAAGTHYMDKRREQQAAGTGAAPVQPQPQAAAPAEPATAGQSSVDQLERLGRLREQGLLTDEEFAQQKAKVLAA